MTRKIVGFKITLRLKEILRRAKKAGIALAATKTCEAELLTPFNTLAQTLRPAVLFETFPVIDTDQAALSPMPGLAYSVILTTLGRDFGAAKDNAYDFPSDLWPIIVDVALEDTVAFATRLLQEDAEDDSCDLSPFSVLSEPAALEIALKKINAGKIGVCFQEGRLSPAASRVVSLSWLSKVRAKSVDKSRK